MLGFESEYYVKKKNEAKTPLKVDSIPLISAVRKDSESIKSFLLSIQLQTIFCLCWSCFNYAASGLVLHAWLTVKLG